MRLIKQNTLNSLIKGEPESFNNPDISDPLFFAWNNFNDLKSESNSPDSDLLYQQICKKAAIPTSSKRNIRIISLKTAGIFLALVTSAFLLYYQFYSDRLITVKTEKGQKKEIILPDGTQVWLNADTKISYHRKFRGRTREINLTGEAYFSVVRDTTRPFIVTTFQLDIKVLGTVFNVKSYPDDKTSETTLVSGSIMIEKKDKETEDKPVILSPKEKAVYSSTRNDIAVEKVNPEKNIYWKSGKLNFDNDPIDLVVKKLERWYGIKIKFETPPEDTCGLTDRYTMIINDENIEEVIRLLQLTSPFTFKISDLNGSFEKIYKPDY
jgi:ferric-dicitrate binding protein FerR (iron transport regulator)